MNLLRALSVFFLFTLSAKGQPHIGVVDPLVVGTSDDSVRRYFHERADEWGAAEAVALRVVYRRESLLGLHTLYRQQVDEQDVIGAEVSATAADGRIVSVEGGLARMGGTSSWPPARAVAPPAEGDLVLLNVGGVVRHALRSVVTRGAFTRDAVYVDAGTGATLLVEPLYFTATAATALFTANPVTLLNDPSLRDRNDDAAAVPAAAYRPAELQDVTRGAPLGGPYVSIVDVDLPRVPVVLSAPGLFFDRGQDAFEDVMAYFHLDRANRYLQELGYFGSRAIAPYSIPVDTHAAAGTDNSFYVPNFRRPGEGALYFGEGGTDDAEDPDILLHEYAHAIQDWVAPNTFSGSFASESRALAEGNSDYLAFSLGYDESISSGRDPFCIAEWDARCAGSTSCGYPEGADCLRRVDSQKTMADFIRNEQSGVEHQNGEIWSSLLREFFVAVVTRDGVTSGRRLADKVVLESLFGTPANPTLATAARRLVQSDVALTGGRYRSVLCDAITRRGILNDGTCGVVARGEWTLLAAPQRNVPIPDGSAQGVSLTLDIDDPRTIEQLLVQVDIVHPHRGDLKITLIGPNGVPVLLQSTSLSDTAADIRVTFGADAQPLESLAVFAGQPAAGRWTLVVTDVAAEDVGFVRSWALLVRYRGDSTLERDERPAIVVPIVGQTTMADGRVVSSDLALLSSSPNQTTALLRFTPYGSQSALDSRSIRIAIPARSVVRLDDVVPRAFFSAGLAVLNVVSDDASLRVMTRSRFGVDRWEAGEGVGPLPARSRAGANERLTVPVDRGNDTRANLGIINLSGAVAVVVVQEFTGSQLLRERTEVVGPYSGSLSPLSGLATRADVRTAAGNISAFASMVDSVGGDAFLTMGERPTEEERVVPLFAGVGARGTEWMTRLRLTNPTTSSLIVNVRPVARDGVELPERVFVLASGAEVLFENAAGELLECQACSGSVRITGAIVTARVVAHGDGVRTESLPQLHASDAVVAGQERRFVMIERNTDAHSNVGVIAGAAGAVADLELRSSSGVTLAQWSVTLSPLEALQQVVPVAVQNGALIVRGRSGAFHVYVSTVSAVSGDSTIQ